jgi:hypothetical protein
VAAHSEPKREDIDLLAQVRSGAWLEAQTFPPLQYAVHGVIPEGLTLFVGPPKVGKSWLLLSVLLAVASGGDALGCIRTGKPQPVLYLALEDGDRRLQDRTRALLKDDPIPAGFHYLLRVGPGLVVATLRAWMERHPDTRLVVLDTLGKVIPPAASGQSSFERDYRIGGDLKRVADDYPGLGLLVIHHSRKMPSSDFVDAVSGTHGLAGSADTILVLSRDRHSEQGLLQVTGRDVEEAEYALQHLDGQWVMHGGSLVAARSAAESVRHEVRANDLGDVMRSIVTYVNGQPPDTVLTPGQVAAAIGHNADTVRRYLSRAADKGLLTKQGRGGYTSCAGVPSVPLSDSGNATLRTLGTAIALGTAVVLDALNDPLTCSACGLPMVEDFAGDGLHPGCATDRWP